VRRQQAQAGERDVPVGQPLEEAGKLSRGARGFNAAIRSVLGQMEHLRAATKQRGEPLAQVQPAPVQLGKCRDERNRCAALVAREWLYAFEELFVSEQRERIDRRHSFF
jgi:hypothetical protein